MDEYYLIKSKYLDNKNILRNIYYYLSITKEDNDTYTINAGNPKKTSCLTIIITNNKKTAILNNVSFKTGKCALLFDDYKKGSIKNLVKCLLMFCCKKFPFITKFILTDNSTIDCGIIEISLADLEYIKYGKTWYEKYFGAKPLYKNTINKIKEELENIKNKNLNQSLIKDAKKYYDIYYTKNNVNKLIDVLKEYYNKNLTYGEYINLLNNNDYDCSTYCYIFNKIFEKKLYGEEWIIKINSVKKYSNDTIYTSKKIEKIKKNSNIEKYNNIVNKLDINKYKNMMQDGFVKIYDKN